MKNKEKNGFSRLLLPEMLTVLIGGDVENFGYCRCCP